MPIISVRSRDQKFYLEDQDGYIYGIYQIRSEAQQAADDWNEYYRRPND